MRHQNIIKIQHALSVLLMFGLFFSWLPLIDLTPKVRAAGESVMLFWDGSDSVPVGWSLVTTIGGNSINGRYPRGESSANVGLTGGGGAHDPTASVTISAPSSQNGTACFLGLCGTSRSTSGHGHTVSVNPGATDNNDDFAHRTLKLIKYDSGKPNAIPAGAIAMFDSTPGVPSGWTRYSDNDGRMVKFGTTITNAGTDAHTHSLPWSALGAATGAQNVDNTANSGSANAHTHTAPATTSTTSTTALPPYVEPLLAKANTDTTALPAGMIAIFDGDPGVGWQIHSSSGGVFNQQFLRPNSGGTYNGTSQGAATHTHANATSGNSGNAAAASGGGTGTGTAGNTHNHTLTATFGSVESLPEYINVVIAEKITFTQSNYRWYVDSDAENVTDPWGSNPDIPQNTSITTLPATASDPPKHSRELRLRTSLTVNAADLPATSIQFKLQYKKGTDGSCTTGSWTDVGAGGGGVVWRFATSGVTDGADLSASQLSPASDVRQDYIKSNPTVANVNGADSDPTPKTIEYDFHIEHNGADGASQYSFRMVESSGLLLNAYTACPTLVTAPAGNNLMRHGSFYQDEVKKGYYWAD